MIRCINGSSATLWDGWGVSPLEAAQIQCLMAATHPGELQLWQQTDERDRPCALLALEGEGGLILSARQEIDPAHTAELARFVALLGATSIELPLELATACGWTPTQVAVVMAQPLPPSTAPGEGETISATGLYKVARAARGGQELGDYDRWLWRFSLRLRRHRAVAMGLWQAGEPVAAGALSHLGDTHAVVGYISTLPPFRNRGLGGQITAMLAAAAHRQGLVPLLACQEELVPFYEKQGFVQVGKQAILAEIQY